MGIVSIALYMISGPDDDGSLLDAAPLFLDAARHDYRLHPLSPGWQIDGVDGPIGWRGYGWASAQEQL